MKIVVISYHTFNSRRKAGFHFIAKELSSLGHEVFFITAGLSLLSKIKGDQRYKSAKTYRADLGFISHKESGVNFYSPIEVLHPVGIRVQFIEDIVNYLLVRKAPPAAVRAEILTADMIVVESCVGLVWLDFISENNDLEGKKIIYRVSDDLTFMGVNRLLTRSEYNLIKKDVFDIVSCPVDVIARKFDCLSDKVIVQQHGLDNYFYDIPWDNPYSSLSNRKNAVFVGISRFDSEVCNVLIENFPEVNFHFIGECVGIKGAPNSTVYGVLSFEETIKYIVHADIGLQTIRVSETDMFKYSLKVLQYSYAGLPIFGPECLDTKWGNFYGYKDRTVVEICRTFRSALGRSRDLSARHHVSTWKSLVQRWL
ncbi:GumK N-terminal domain-containing glycosyltransferase [Castellaniella sp. S9]|uniref:GumK N-terminal domain-containing glycosyltransferase n=1 Tax=Castellaniella sp. S9 TaxID=2993652 RepID=UPI0022B4C531|nr:hypothetical protein [Castellaniella sp. S9]